MNNYRIKDVISLEIKSFWGDDSINDVESISVIKKYYPCLINLLNCD